MKIVITGPTGLIGTALQKQLGEQGWDMLLATRHEPKSDNEIRWSAEDGFADTKRLEGVDAVVHLAGASVNGLRWTDGKKKAIRDSRVLGTRNLIGALRKLKKRPKVLVSASAIGFYGERADEEITESSPAGNTFLAEVSKEWEGEARRAEDAGIRTVLLRT